MYLYQVYKKVSYLVVCKELGNFVDNCYGGIPWVMMNAVAPASVSLDFVVSYEDEMRYDANGLGVTSGNCKRKLTYYRTHFHS